MPLLILMMLEVQTKKTRDGVAKGKCTLSGRFLPADDEDGMDGVDSERRPHFPQFSYSASGRE